MVLDLSWKSMRKLKTCAFSHHVYICHGVSSFILKTDSITAIPVFKCLAECAFLSLSLFFSLDPLHVYFNLPRLSSYFYWSMICLLKIYHIIYLIWCDVLCVFPLRLDLWRLMLFLIKTRLSTNFKRSSFKNLKWWRCEKNHFFDLKWTIKLLSMNFLFRLK